MFKLNNHLMIRHTINCNNFYSKTFDDKFTTLLKTNNLTVPSKELPCMVYRNASKETDIK